MVTLDVLPEPTVYVKVVVTTLVRVSIASEMPLYVPSSLGNIVSGAVLSVSDTAELFATIPASEVCVVVTVVKGDTDTVPLAI